jgi:biotin carboxyl carrier protein
VTFDVETGGRRYTVEIGGGPNRYRAVVNGRVTEVDAVGVDGAWSLLVADGAGEAATRRSYDVRVSEDQSGRLLVLVDGCLVPVEIHRTDRIEWRDRVPGGAHAPGGREGDGPRPLVAPMPGRIVKVLAAPGDVVAARQGLVVVEAMKMENELRAPRAGVVREVRVREGVLVEARAVLMVIE